MRKKQDDVRAAVIAALMAGEGVCDVSRRFSLSKATVSRIKNSLGKKTLERIETEKGQQLAELVFRCLKTNFETLCFIAETIRDENWLRKNTAADVSLLYGVMADKASRITEAVQAGEGEPEDTSVNPGSTTP